MEVRRSKQSGFTLVESMVSLSVLLIGLLALAMMQNVSFKANTAARNRMAATILASQRIERMSRLGATATVTGSGSTSVDGRTFSESWACSAAPTATNGSKVVNMQVQWSDTWGTQTLSFPTVVR